MKYYHGTKSQISEFNIPGTGKHGEGFYFTPDLNEAYYFARTLVGEGNPNQSPRIYTVNLSFSNLFNSMNPEHCQIVLNSLNQNYKIPRSAGGAKEHYHYLKKQLQELGYSNPNKIIKAAGYDGILYDLMEHVIVFNSDQ